MPAATIKDFGFGTQIRKSPFFDATVRWGATDFSVYNHMYIPRSFGDPEQNFWNLVNDAILCDVAVERQVEITGPRNLDLTLHRHVAEDGVIHQIPEVLLRVTE